ncbi:uncharacterized protein Nmlp_2787 [Natronomonas moolapensis 8.8.11]|uniref:UCP012666 family protein n=1 Tax=Natronomonas moolapensis (strain DSM 18674 / CECT 7526 / JCM 14361 / 8.8.11) TaxID=268739 RepID=M1XRP0_NATM8|nr:hypothetical protein [Natronomonas moolapensis]CCQ36939.1 uncharacterized protein Nmlp_2787 [Natronomonas moolapensis 8.8.11]
MSDATGETVELVRRALDPDTAEPFEARLTEQARWLRAAIEEGRMDNPDFAVGLEMEVYAVAGGNDGSDGAGPRLTRLPEEVFETAAANKELGLHNVEINTDPSVLSETGLETQAEAIRERTQSASSAARDHGCELVLDAMWTLPPTGGAMAYLSATAERDGVVLAENMRQDPRYVGIDNDALRHGGGGPISLSVPGADIEFPTILFESLATSIQPHLQVPSAAELPAYYNAAIRTLGPILALSANSPFLPAELYGDADDPEALVEATPHELRIDVFEQSVNRTPNAKVSVPRDIGTATDVVDRVLEDGRYAPFLREWIDGETERTELADRIWEFDHKRGTYWRWLRCVIGGARVDAANDERSLRIEYRPIPTQPSVADVVGMQALVAGVLRGLVGSGHPVAELPWSAAESSFYDAVENGLDAELAWVTAAGERTSDSDVIFDELFEHARSGLEAEGVPADDIEQYLSPIERRWSGRATPSSWKKARVRDALEEGADLPGAIAAMQREYIARSREGDAFVSWL